MGLRSLLSHRADARLAPRAVRGARRRAVAPAVSLTLGAVALLSFAPAALAQVSFSAPTSFAAGDEPASVAVGDFNADSDPDLAVANADSDNVSVLLGGAGGGFGAPTSFAAGDEPASVAVGDFNGDADPDLAVANAGSDNVSVLLGGAGGSFGAADQLRRPATGPSRSRWATSTPTATPTWRSPTATSATSRCCSAARAGASAPATNFAGGDSPRSVAVGDFNADSDPDLAVATASPDDVSVLLGGRGGSFGADDRLRRR